MSERDFVANVTILSGDLDGDDGPPGSFENYGDNSFHVVRLDCNLCQNPPVFDGFTITAGNADGPVNEQTARGGGIYSEADGGVIANCAIIHNRATFGGGLVGGDFGALVSNCQFIENFSTSDGAGYFGGGDVHFFQCLFQGNASQFGGGGGAWTTNSASMIFEECVFSSNLAAGGALYINEASGVQTATMLNCEIAGHTMISNSAAVHVEADCSFAADGCEFADNEGTAIRSFGGTLSISDCTFQNHSDTAVFSSSMVGDVSLVTTNCTFVANAASGPDSQGGGIFFEGNAAVITGCDFSDNSANEGGALYARTGAVTLDG